jgi:hypothetical protein
MPVRVTKLLVLVAALLATACAAAPGAGARSIAWSGYTWDVRPPGTGGPGPNAWSDSTDNVRVEGTDLVLATVRDASGTWTSAEVDNTRHLGYGTYRWVVSSDLSTLDAHEVLGMFTYGGDAPSNNEIDIEPSHWGNLAWDSGSVTSWQDAAANLSQGTTFRYSDRPPYVNQFTWEPGRISWLVTDATGATLLRWSVTSGVPVPSTEVPVTNYWRYKGVPPAAERSVRIASFAWAPPGAEGDLPPLPSATAAPAPASPPAAATAWGCGLSRTPATGRTAAAGRRDAATVTWTAGKAADVRLAVRRRTRGGRLVRVGTVRRAVAPGTGRLRFAGWLGRRRLAAGRYRLDLTVRAPGGRVVCGPKRLAVTLRAG